VTAALVEARCFRDLIPETAEVIAALDGVAEATVPEIMRTHTISAFRVYAKADREAGFTLGQR